MRNRLFADLSSNNAYFHAHDYRAAGHVLVAIKATEGTGYINPFHAEWTRAAHAEKISVIHYHFARPDAGNSPEAEALAFLRAAAGMAGKRDWLALDYERFTGAGAGADVAWCNTFWRAVRSRTRFRTWLYASRSTHQDFDSTGRLIIKRRWDADWSTAPDYKSRLAWSIARQMNDGETGPGPHSLQGVGRCDVNRISWRVFARIHV